MSRWIAKGPEVIDTHLDLSTSFETEETAQWMALSLNRLAMQEGWTCVTNKRGQPDVRRRERETPVDVSRDATESGGETPGPVRR